jgi:MFS family permease
MYSQSEIDEAVAAGAISADAANALRSYVEGQRHLPTADEEQFRLITGFNDIFVAIAAAILLFAVGWIGQWIGQSAGTAIEGDGPSFLGPAAVAAASWALALFFTAKRRMALPSILLLLAFVGGVVLTSGFALVLGIGSEAFDDNPQLGGVVGAVAAAIGAAAAWLHWKRFRVPITVAAGAASVAGILVALLVAALGQDVEQSKNLIFGFLLLLGIGTFLFAMWWDGSDRARMTRRSDVAFWLHLLAAPMIVHPVFTLLGLNDGNATVGEGFVVILLYVVIGLAALAIDRRALLVSALAYVLFAMQQLFQQFGAVELNVALTALVIGSALLMLSAFWHQARSVVVRPLPAGLKDRLPLIDRSAPLPQPAA